MTVQITVVGLHQVGASIGLALSKYKDKIVLIGFDEDVKHAGNAEKLKAFAKIEHELPNAVKNADLVLLAVPADIVHEYLGLLSPALKENAQVIDTSLLHQNMDEQAAAILRADNHFISATPILNPAYMDESSEDAERPHDDLFSKGALLICSGPKTQPDMIKVAADLAELLGTHAYFTDPLEADAILTEVELLPKLAAAALLNTAATNPGWGDSGRVAGKAFLKSTSALEHFDEIEEFGKAALQARVTTLHALDRLSAKIAEIRAAVEKNDARELKELLAAARTEREDWLAFKMALDWRSPDGKPEDAREMAVRPLFQGFKRKGK
jgi:prephenate dehydrogenase